jgi:hypothetical protein
LDRWSRLRATLATTLGAALMAGCGPPPSWQQLLASKISDHYPAYTVQALPDGNLQVTRPGLAGQHIDVQAIASFCQRGPKDCNYATDQMLLGLLTGDTR